MTDYLTRAEWFLLGFASGAVIALVAVALCVAVLMPDIVIRVRRRRRGDA